jgi:membrane-anchored mycosin MYCP
MRRMTMGRGRVPRLEAAGALALAAALPVLLAAPPARSAVLSRPLALPLPQVLSRPQAPLPPCNGEPRGNTSPGNAIPWAQQQLNFADAWRFARGGGGGVTVAVVDSGVSVASPQLGGRLTEADVTGTPADIDCVGHGTGVAGIIAAAKVPGNPFFGVAPAADILSVKVTDQTNVDCTRLAEGIQTAVGMRAQVINVSTQCGFNAGGLPDLRRAVVNARDHDIVIVAAAGNDTNTGGTPPFYPANYSADPATFPNVLSVGALQQDGTLLGVSDRRTHVSVAAPGSNVLTIAPARTFQAGVQGTSYAAPFVAGVAALVIASHPNLRAAQVVSRIVATADGGTGTGTGAGMVDPLQAVTAVLPGEGQAVTPTASPPPSPVAVPRAQAPDSFTRMLILSVTGGSLAAAVLVVVGALVIPAGRRRGWRPGPP